MSSQHTSFAKLAAQFQSVNLQTLLWRPKAKVNAEGLAPIMLRITVDGQRIERSSGLRVAEADWEPKNGGRIRGNSVVVKKQNEQLQLLKAHVSELVNLMKATGRLVTARTLAVQLESPSVGKCPCFIALCQQQLDLHYGANPTSYAARQHGLRTLIDWRGRDSDGKPVALPVDEFTPELATALYQWLLSVRRHKVSTANSVVGTMETLFKRAAEMGLVELADNPFRLLRKKKKAPTQRLRLSLAEFAALRDMELSDPRATLARDVYVTQYYLHGSRMGAVVMLRWQDVTATHVRLQAEKGGPLKQIRLAPELGRVLARYRPAEASPAALIFPVLPPHFHALLTPAEQFKARKVATTAINRGLRLVEAAAGLPAGLHAHTARHTLALHAATAAGLRVAQTMLGHKSIKQTEAYIGELADEALNEAERLLYGTGSPHATAAHAARRGWARGAFLSGGMRRAEWIAQQRGRKAVLYVVRVWCEGEAFYKVGVTFCLSSRFSRLKTLYKWRTVARYSSWNAGRVFDLEQRLHAAFAHLSYLPTADFGGKTECYSEVELILAALPKSTFFLKPVGDIL